MKSFNGLIDEIDFISIDRFESGNMDSKMFFLSHCHADHMIGLNEKIQLPGILYCSEISSIFLKRNFPNLTSKIEILELEEASVLYDRTNNTKLVVTTIAAAHCPGSVMFIFEMENKRILYTGDFRISKYCENSSSLLTNKNFDKVYMDSTFLNQEYKDFPKMNESLQIIFNLTKSWITKGSKYKVIIEKPAQHSLQVIVQKLKEVKTIIFIENNLEQSLYFPHMDNCLSNDRSKASIFITEKIRSEFEYQKTDNFIYRILKPTALYWRNWSRFKNIFKHEGNEVYRIGFSNHCSLNEIKYFLFITKPKEVQLNTFPENSMLKFEMKTLLSKIFKTYMNSNTGESQHHFGLTRNQNLNQFLQPNVSNSLPSKRVKLN